MKSKTIYACQKCGAQSPKWLGKCPDCGEWNSYVEETVSPKGAPSGSSIGGLVKSLEEIDSAPGNHISTGINELDRVLGGGYVPGSAILIGGEPGIGKSTLLLHMLSALCKKGKKVLYLSGEESASQIKTRADRLKVKEKNLLIGTENCLENILQNLNKNSWDIVAIDSVQTIYSQNLNSAPGTVSQVRECSGAIITHAKKSGTACLLVGHVTKEGAIAGPKILEHMVDCVLYFESDPGHAFRILRSVKNRFGPANEIGVFEMTGAGLSEVANPSHLFLSNRGDAICGSVVVCSLEGTRPLLLEIQSLVSKAGLGIPRRTAIGIENSRMALLIAVLEKIIGAQLYDQDVFVNIAGGLKVNEPALDLGISMAIFSSFRNITLPAKTVFIGEVGLSGEVRTVSQIDARLKEASKMGFQKVILPKGNMTKLHPPQNLELIGINSLPECLQQIS